MKRILEAFFYLIILLIGLLNLIDLILNYIYESICKLFYLE